MHDCMHGSGTWSRSRANPVSSKWRIQPQNLRLLWHKIRSIHCAYLAWLWPQQLTTFIREDESRHSDPCREKQLDNSRAEYIWKTNWPVNGTNHDDPEECITRNPSSMRQVSTWCRQKAVYWSHDETHQHGLPCTVALVGSSVMNQPIPCYSSRSSISESLPSGHRTKRTKDAPLAPHEGGVLCEVVWA